MKGKMYIISLKASPGLIKEFILLGDMLKKRGYLVKYILAEDYGGMEWKRENAFYFTGSSNIKGILIDIFKFYKNKHRELSKRIRKFSPSSILFYNFHPINLMVVSLVRKLNPNIKMSLYLHEPYKLDKSYYGFKKSIYIMLIEFIQGMVVKHMDYVILPSQQAFSLFKMKYSDFKGEGFISPLCIPDCYKKQQEKRKYFSMVGNANLATGHDAFIELVNYIGKKEFEYEFCLISSSDISRFLKKLTKEGRKKLKIINKQIIKDSEINKVIQESYAVFRLDKEVTQSGVIPVSYMNATPIIARNIAGLRQHVQHKNNGYLIPNNSTTEDFMDAMSFVKDNFSQLSKNARQSYEDMWSECNFEKYYSWLLYLLNTK